MNKANFVYGVLAGANATMALLHAARGHAWMALIGAGAAVWMLYAAQIRGEA